MAPRQPHWGSRLVAWAEGEVGRPYTSRGHPLPVGGLMAGAGKMVAGAVIASTAKKPLPRPTKPLPRNTKPIAVYAPVPKKNLGGR